MLCKKCNNEILDGETVCSKCGCPVSEMESKEIKQENADKNSFESVSQNNFNESEKGVSEDKNQNYFENENFSNNKNLKTKSTVRGLLLSFIAFIILGGVFIIFMNIYNNSPERIFEEVRQSEKFEKYITKKGYTVLGYYFIDLINNDGKKEIVIDVADKKEGIERRLSYIAFKENGSYKIGVFLSVGGELIDDIEIFKNISEPKGLFVHIKNVDEVSQESIDAIKIQTGIDKDDFAKEILEQEYGVGSDQYAIFNMIDSSFLNFSEKNAEMNSYDFSLSFAPEKIVLKRINQDTKKPEYSYIDVYEENLKGTQTNITEQPDYSISEDEFNNYINEFKNGKEKVEYFKVSEENKMDLNNSSETAETETKEDSSETETKKDSSEITQ